MKAEFYFADNTGEQAAYESILASVFTFCVQKLLPECRQPVLSLTLVDAATSQKINSEYRDSDRVADVISFAYLDDEKEKIEGNQALDLGELIICPAAVKERADAIGNDFKMEMIYLFIHGFLHLIGYDHVDSEEEAEKMFRVQEEVFTEYREENL